MRGTWLDFGQELNPPLLAKHSISDVAFDIRDPQLSRSMLQRVQGQGFTPGVYACSQGEGWPQAGSISGYEFAHWVNERLAPLNISQNVPFVHLNSETHDVNWLIIMLDRWRELRPKKRTLWSLEGMQGGLFEPHQVKAIEGHRVEYGPQAYKGDMTRIESSTVVLDLVNAGFSADRIQPFLPADDLGWWWEGWAFPAGRLP